VHVTSGEGEVRLIDNVLLSDVPDEQRLLDALPPDGPPGSAGHEG